MASENIISHCVRSAIDFWIVLLTDLRHEILHVDKSTVTAIKVGISLGIVLLTILTLFPGEPFEFEYNADNADKKIYIAPASKEGTEKKNCKLPPKINDIQIEKMQQKFGLSREQMELVLKKSMNKEEVDGNDNDFFLSWKQILNSLVYIGILITLVMVINKEYNYTASIWLVHFFPKEAATLKIIERE